MRVLGRRVLVEQLMIPLQSKIIRVGNDKEKNKENFDVSFKILEVGPECPKEEGMTINVGEVPVFDKNVTFLGAKVIEESKEKTVIHTIVYYDDIIAVE